LDGSISIIYAPTGFEASWLTYSMAYGGTLIPGSVAITPHHYALSIQSSDDSPCGSGMERRYPPKISVIVSLGHSPLSFASGHWSPQHSIIGTQSPHWLTTGWPNNPSHTLTSLNSHCLDSLWSQSGLQRWAQSARRGWPPNHAASADSMGLCV